MNKSLLLSQRERKMCHGFKCNIYECVQSYIYSRGRTTHSCERIILYYLYYLFLISELVKHGFGLFEYYYYIVLDIYIPG